MYNYQHKTVEVALEIMGACGVTKPEDMSRHHIMHRRNGRAESYAETFPPPNAGELVDAAVKRAPRTDPLHESWARGLAILESAPRGGA